MIERIAIPKKGRVYEQVFSLMLDAGLVLKREGRLDFCVCKALGVEVYFLPAKDIPEAVASGAIQYGITGQDLIANAQANVDQHLNLGIGRAKMVLASPEIQTWEGAKSLNDKRIGSSYTTLAKQYLEQKGVVGAKLFHFDGSVEVQVALGVVDAIVDITETGSSLRANNLVERDTILSSEMVLISTAGYRGDFLPLIIKRIERVIRGKTHVMLKCNLPKSMLARACLLSMGMSSPTVNHLANEDWVAIEVAIHRNEVHHLMDQLIELGATGILSHELSLCAPN